MSLTLHVYVDTPHASGMVYGHDRRDPLQYEALAYHHSDIDEVWFGGMCVGPPTIVDDLAYYRVRSAINGMVSPQLADHEVRAIPLFEWQWLRRKERLYWRFRREADAMGMNEDASKTYAHQQLLLLDASE